jgi:hypothetical protein
MPPPPIRRPLTITAWLVLSTMCLILSPLILAAGAVAAAVMRRPQPRLLARLVVAYFARELLVLIACGGLWLACGCGWRIRRPRFQLAHYRLLRWFVAGMASRVRRLLHITVETEPEPGAAEALNADRPVLVFSRHAGPADTVFITDILMSGYDRLPSVVFKDALALDPVVAALSGNPESDVVFAAHTGLGLAAFPGQLWRHPPIGRTLTAHMWRVSPDERPDDPDAQVDWLYGSWQRIDDWVEAQGEERGSERFPRPPSRGFC